MHLVALGQGWENMWIAARKINGIVEMNLKINEAEDVVKQRFLLLTHGCV